MTDDLERLKARIIYAGLDAADAMNEALARIKALTEEIGQLQARVEDQAREIADLTRQLQGQPRRAQDVAVQNGAEP